MESKVVMEERFERQNKDNGIGIYIYKERQTDREGEEIEIKEKRRDGLAGWKCRDRVKNS